MARRKVEASMDKIIHLSAHLSCSPRRAFELFTRNDRLESWLAPHAEVEPAIGGAYHIFWAPDDRENDSTLGCRITAMEPDQFISFEWRSPRQFKDFANNADPLTHVVVFFIPIPTGTDVHLIHSGWRGTPEWDAAREWQEKAWQIAFERLEGQAHQGGSL
jgi:uncharacterized protein YndB with AHSA1/START domain